MRGYIHIFIAISPLPRGLRAFAPQANAFPLLVLAVSSERGALSGCGFPGERRALVRPAPAEIARRLFVTVATVKAHVSRPLTKLQVENRVQIPLLVHDAALGPRRPER